MTVVYHHTSTRHLPWIVEDEELRPSGSGYDRWFGKTFIWGSTVPNGDPSAAIHRPACGPHRDLGHVMMVRFTFRDCEFVPWTEIKRKYAKTKKHKASVKLWQKLDEKIGVDVDTWWLRNKPLPIAAALAVEAKGYGHHDRWRPIDLSPKSYYEDFQSCEGNGWDHPGCDGDEGFYGATLMRTGNSALYDRDFWAFEPLPEAGLWEPTAFSAPIKPRRSKWDW